MFSFEVADRAIALLRSGLVLHRSALMSEVWLSERLKVSEMQKVLLCGVGS
jgi:hypothetical protein